MDNGVDSKIRIEIQNIGNKCYLWCNAPLLCRFVVGLSFRALSDDGLLLYGTDNDTHPTQFFSLELVHGKLVFKFNSGKGLVSMTSEEKYSGNGQWFSVRISHYIAISYSSIDRGVNDYGDHRH